MSPPTRSERRSPLRTTVTRLGASEAIAEEANAPGTGSLFGYAIASELPLARLAPEPGRRGTLRVELANEPLLERTGELLAWSESEPGRRVGYALARAAEGPLVWCSLSGTFLIDGRAQRVRVEPARCAPGHLEHRLVATAIPLLAAELGDLVLHASAVVADGGAILFCGPSGRGKSTLALGLADAGMPLLTEDGTVITLGREPLAWPGPLGIRVHAGAAPSFATREPSGDDGEVPMRLVAPAVRETRAAPVRAIVVLEPRGGGRAVAEPLRAADAVPALVPDVIAAGEEHLASLFPLAARAADTMPVWRGRVPDDLSVAPGAAVDLVRIVAAG